MEMEKSTMNDKIHTNLVSIQSWMQFRSQYFYNWRPSRFVSPVSLHRNEERYHSLWESPESPQSPWIEVKDE
ncbi:hypothetical protein SAMN04487866_10863 [Thermoactinomyces sp. DSM 45891]|uniref:hypothetical protein n=1 Tax=Thermoactinomyces sp. DSM 45891 TaxID=1761907 RepID=UPI000915906B|nr:hypothetical protein [Thermoactinomyces sp. DSM 45891]SFX45380.1 hypothetical protein SAMN04487866_10863 [Thermoactinomyces sp. DSM 45891]